MKVLLILVDGMRPDALNGSQSAQEFISKSTYAMNAQTVMPSVTLPCHFSLFHSVDPSRHGTTTNVYTPQVRPIAGLCEVLSANRKSCAFFYNWEELRDLSRPGSLVFSCYCSGPKYGYLRANEMVTDEAIKYLSQNDTDFAFLYLGLADDAGHRYGWMSKEYMEAVQSSWANISRVVSVLPEDYTVIVTADHGGHDRTHGVNIPEDMTIPIIIKGDGFTEGKLLNDVNIIDIAPTITAILGVAPDPEWEGNILL